VPTAGLVEVRGLTPHRDRIENARRMGVVFGQRSQLWWDLPVVDSFDLLRAIYRVPEPRYRENLDRFRDLLGLDEFLATPVRQLSLGQRMRADLAAAFMHDPEVVFLDEPTIGLDLVAKDRIRDFIGAINRERGVTVVLTTHDMADIEAICRRIMIIDTGRVILDGSIEDIRERFGRERVLVVDFEEGAGDAAWAGIPARLVKCDGNRCYFSFDRARASAAEVIAAIGGRRPIRDLAIQETDIEDIVRRIYRNGMGVAL
jgi:ABC-2 type transport system ATP-binding protein